MKARIFDETPVNPRRVWAWTVPLLLVLFITFGQLSAVIPAVELGYLDIDRVETYPSILYVLFAAFGMGGLILFAWVRLFERRGLDSIGLALPLGRSFRTGALAGLAMATASVLGIWLAGAYQVESPQDFMAVSYLPILLLAFGFLVQSSVEEIFFRGWMLQRVSERYGLWAGVISNALLFTLMHVDQGEDVQTVDLIIFFTMTMAFSIFLSFMVIRQKSVWGACAWHAAWNWSFITWFGLPTTGIALDITPLWVDLVAVDGAPQWLTGGITGPENSAVTSLVLLIGCGVYAFWPKRDDVAQPAE